MTAASLQHPVVSTDEFELRPDRHRPVVAHCAVWIVAASIFFAEVLASGFARLVGDQGDGRLAVYLDEWWFVVVHGRGSWRTPPFFTPTPNTLGLTDTYLIDQVVYAPFRLLGADPYLAYQLTAIALTAVGFVGWSIMVRRLFHASLAVRLVSATLFAFSGGLALHGEHPQLFGIEVIPWIVVSVAGSWTAPTRRGQFVLGWVAGFVTMVEAASTFYVFYFAAMALLAFSVLRAVVTPRRAWSVGRSVLTTTPMALVGAVGGLALGGALFASIYLPAYRVVGGYPRALVLSFAPVPSDLVNLGSTDLLRGSVSTWLAGPRATHGGEVSYGLSPLLLGVTVVLLVGVSIAQRSLSAVATPLCLLLVSLSGAVIAVRWGSFFAWDLVRWLPGASAIRAVGRTGLMANAVLLLGCCAGCAPHRWTTAPAKKRRPFVAVVLVVITALLLFEQVHTSAPVHLSRSSELAMVAKVPKVPSSCRYFALASFRPTERLVDVQTHAMMLSLHVRLPTVNGYSGSFPKGWNLFATTSPAYRHAVAEWATVRHLNGPGCIYNATTMQWSAVEPIGRLNWPAFGI